MALSVKTKESRFEAVRKQMAEHGLDVLIARGSSAVRGDGAAFRFLTDFPNINIPLVVIFFRKSDKPPVLLVESRFQAMRAAKDSWAGDIRLSTNFFHTLTEVLRESNMDRGAVGIDGLHNFPLLWGQRMARMDFLLKSNGVEKTFNIISQGSKVDAYVPSARKIKNKGMVFTELTANYGGFWTQLARAVSLGKPDSKLVKLHQGAVKAIREALPHLKPGNKVSQPMSVMEESVKRSGLGCTAVYGHIVGIDMV